MAMSVRKAVQTAIRTVKWGHPSALGTGRCRTPADDTAFELAYTKVRESFIWGSLSVVSPFTPATRWATPIFPFLSLSLSLFLSRLSSLSLVSLCLVSLCLSLSVSSLSRLYVCLGRGRVYNHHISCAVTIVIKHRARFAKSCSDVAVWRHGVVCSARWPRMWARSRRLCLGSRTCSLTLNGSTGLRTGCRVR